MIKTVLIVVCMIMLAGMFALDFCITYKWGASEKKDDTTVDEVKADEKNQGDLHDRTGK